MKRLVSSVVTALALLANAHSVLAGEIFDHWKQLNREGKVRTVEQSSQPGDEKPKHGISEIGIERDGCLGNCPVYSLVIRDDGTFRYFGYHFVKHTGFHYGSIWPQRFARVAEFIASSGFMDLADNYDASFTDGPSAFVMAVKDGQRKVVRNYADVGPNSLWAIETLIDSLMDSAKFEEPGKRQQNNSNRSSHKGER